MTVLLEYIDLQLIFSSQHSCKSDFYHVCTLSHSASCKIGRVSASHITNAQKFCLVYWHYADALASYYAPNYAGIIGAGLVGGWGEPDSFVSCCIFEAANNHLLVVSHC